MIRKLAAVLAFMAAILIATAGQSEADDGTPWWEQPNTLDSDTTQAICIANRLGQTPGQIAANIHAGDPRWNTTNAWTKTWFTLAEGDCG